MPTFHIQDSETGLQLEVDGDDEPTQKDAEELIGKELSFLKTNLYSFPGGKYILDVGPSRQFGEIFDKSKATVTALDRLDKEFGATAPNRNKGESLDDYSARLNKWVDDRKSFTAKFIAEEESKASTSPYSYRSQMAEHMAPGSFLLVSHGGESGGLSADEDIGGHKFSLANVASLLGTNAQSISNIINTACYGGVCRPEDYTKHFPNVNTIYQTPTNMPNTTSIGGFKSGQFFGTGADAIPVEAWAFDPLSKAWKMETKPSMPKLPR